ncbi:MAG: HDIG domain-containing protein [Defluviitaleaceae bacterium]|nr:HDIG domain-containing protein [Defluviitaleaceae bacterium]
MKKKFINLILIFSAFFVTCVAIALGSYFNAGLEMEVGSVSETRVRAPRDAENVAETERNRQAALVRAAGLAESFTVDPSEWHIVENNLFLRREELDSIRAAYTAERAEFDSAFSAWEEDSAAHTAESETVRAAWERERAQAQAANLPIPQAPIMTLGPERPEFVGASLSAFFEIPIRFDEEQQESIVKMSDDIFFQMWEAIEYVADKIQNTEVIRDVDFLTQIAVSMALRDFSLGRGNDELAEHIILFSLRPNAIPNVELNERNFQAAANNFEIVMIYENDIIVDEGEIVTQEIYDTLFRLDMLAPESLLDNIYPILGVIFLTAMLFLACVMFLIFYRKGITTNSREAMLLFTLYMLTVALVWTLSDLSFPFLPILIFPMLVSTLIDRRCAAVLSFALIFICFFIVDGNLTYLFFYSVSGILFCIFSRYTTDRGKSIWVGLIMSAIMFASAIAVSVITERTALDDLNALLMTAGFAAASGILTVFLCMGSLPLWETFFGVVTPIKLLDLTNPTNLLLRRLTIEAPGTYHHSLIVANLAETAAFDIGANAPAARVGGYYHDVGKLKFPHYFVENLDGDNPHDHFDPLNSAQIILSHVSYGLALATEHRLPQFVRDIIREHHGTTVLQYFFSKAREKDISCDEKDFRYPYLIPQSKESACVMLADSVEAAVRSMIPKIKSVDEVEKTIQLIIRGKLTDGQLAESDLSIKDVAIIEQSFFRVLKGMYHERIAYPTARAAEKKSKVEL